MIHAIGHALGLGHDDRTTCPASQRGVMQTPTPAGEVPLSLTQYCQLASDVNDPNEPCAVVVKPELGPGENHPCEDKAPNQPPGPPSAGMEICDGRPWLCQPDPPWNAAVHGCGYACEIRNVATVTTTDINGEVHTAVVVYYYCGCMGAASNAADDVSLVSPVVWLDAPTTGQSISGLFHIRGWATSFFEPLAFSVAVDGEQVPWQSLQLGILDFRACDIDQGGLGASFCNANSGFDGVIDTRSLSNGPHEIQLSVLNAEGATNPLSIPVVVSNCGDYESPASSLNSPLPGATLSGSVALSASASDNVAVSRVDFRVNGVTVASDTAPPYSATWNSLSVANGTHVLRARAVDGCGNQFTSPPVTVTVANPPANSPPQVWIDAPAVNQVVTSRYISWYGWATDTGGVSNLEFRLDGQIRPFSWSWGSRPDVCSAVPLGDPRCPNVGWGGTLDLYGVAPGSHTISVTAYDALGLSTSVSRAIQVANSSPSGLIDAPWEGRSISGSRVTVAGWVTDSDGIESVRLELDGQAVTPLEPWTRLPRPDICGGGSPIDPSCPNAGFKIAFNSTQFVDGVHSLRAIFRDTRGIESFHTRNLVFRNNPTGTLIGRSASDDTHVRSTAPTTVHGSQSSLLVRGSTTETSYGLVKFDLTGLTGQVRSARLRFVPVGSAAPRVNVFRITSGTWSEESFTWNDLGSLTWTLFDMFFDLPANSSGSIIDVTDAVSLGGTVTFGFSTEAPNAITFASSESSTTSYRPYLEIRKQ